MWRKLSEPGPINNWVWRNRLFLWWLLIFPCFAVALPLLSGAAGGFGRVAREDGAFLAKVLNNAPLIFLYRLVALAVALVLLLICLFFPVMRVSSEGVSWTQEIEEKLVDFAGQAAADEVAMLVEEENRRWQALRRLHLEPSRVEIAVAFQDSSLLCEIFPVMMVVQMVKRAQVCLPIRFILFGPCAVRI